jgi:enoyl-CoA hydratase/carnithine racemase
MGKVNYWVSNHLASIEMNRPDRHNALDYELLDDIDSAFTEAERDDDVYVIVLSGAGRSLCSSYDRDRSY